MANFHNYHASVWTLFALIYFLCAMTGQQNYDMARCELLLPNYFLRVMTGHYLKKNLTWPIVTIITLGCEHWLSCSISYVSWHVIIFQRLERQKITHGGGEELSDRDTQKHRAQREREREREEGELRASSCTHNLHKISVKISVAVLYWVSVFVFYCCFLAFFHLLMVLESAAMEFCLHWNFRDSELRPVSQLPRFCSFRFWTSLCLEFRSRDLCACLCLRVCVCVCARACLCLCVFVCVFFLGVECGGKIWSSKL
jgi:hypothetical protein